MENEHNSCIISLLLSAMTYSPPHPPPNSLCHLPLEINVGSFTFHCLKKNIIFQRGDDANVHVSPYHKAIYQSLLVEGHGTIVLHVIIPFIVIGENQSRS